MNTGGMGAYAPAPVATPSLLKTIDSQIVKPTIDGMRRDGMPFVGVLFTGMILVKDSKTNQLVPEVLEYNVRFGDPETQAVLSLLDDRSFHTKSKFTLFAGLLFENSRLLII